MLVLSWEVVGWECEMAERRLVVSRFPLYTQGRIIHGVQSVQLVGESCADLLRDADNFISD